MECYSYALSWEVNKCLQIDLCSQKQYKQVATAQIVIAQTEVQTLKAHQRATCGLTVAVVLFVSEQCY